MSIRLSAPAREWVRRHAEVVVGVVPEWPPIDGIDELGAQTGVSADVLARVAQVLGLRTRVVRFDDFQEAIAAVAAGRVDILSSTARTPEREKTLSFTQSYLVMPVVYIGRRGLADFSETGEFGGLRIAVERGYPTHEWLLREHPRARVVVVDDTLAALRAVAEGRADVYRGALTPAHYLIERELLANLEVLSTGLNATTALSFASASQDACAALDAALDWIGAAGLRTVAGRWQPEYLALTPELRPVLPSHGAVAALGEVRVLFDASFGPISAVADDGTPTGLAPALFKRAADAIGLHYRLIPRPSFEDAQADLIQGKAEVILAAVRTLERERSAVFVGPYYSEPAAIVSLRGVAWPSLGALAGHRLAIDAGHYLIPYISRAYPSLRLVIVRTASGVLDAVEAGEADAGITNVEVAAAHVEREFAGRLQVSGLVEDNPSELSFMVRADRPELAQAIRAGFDAVPVNDRRMLANTLLRTTVRVGMSWRDAAWVLVPLAGAMLGLLTGGLLYARRLRRAQAHLQAERDQARAAADAREEFIAELAHDVRTPLAALASGLRLLARATLSRDAIDILGSLTSSAERTLALLNRLLDMARLESGHFELHRKSTDLESLLRACVAPFGPLASERGTRIVIEPIGPLPLLLLDPPRTQQVINNLISNAVKFTERGTVSVRLTGKKASSGVWKLRLEVEDTGIGMEAEHVRSLFERYSQAPGTQERYGGVGLGMAISAQIVRNAGGLIDVRSEPGKGTVFTVRILAEEAAEASEPLGAPALSILLVDDDPVCRIVSSEQLRAIGFDVETAPDCDTALRELGTDRYDVLVTDMSINSDGEGLKLAKLVTDLGLGRLRKIVALSGQDRPASVPAPFDLWLTKPSHPGDRDWLQELVACVGDSGKSGPGS
ncbi:MAG: transporter substrate-binding domain-containing protein [Proteobacteria bacterium]|nr:transporter substrate-binding domain-containing protein [Pseudomonadota bacterium]